MARLAAVVAVLLLAAFAYADDTAPSAAPAVRSYFTAPIVALSPDMVEGTAMGPSAEESTDPDAGTAGSPGANYPPVTDNVDAVAPAGSTSGASALGVSSAAAAVSVAAVAGYFAF